MRFYRESLLGGLRDQTVATTANLKIRRYFESSDIALVFQELYMNYLRAEVDDSFDDKEFFLFPIEVNAELLCLSSQGLIKILAKFGSDSHRLILKRKKTREGTWIKINWNKFRRIIFKDPANTFEEIAKKHKIKKQQELEEAESTPEVDHIYDLWCQGKAVVVKPKKLTDELRMLIAKAIDKYSQEVIEEAIGNLELATTHEEVKTWYTHKWSLKKFLTQSNALPNWIGEDWEASAMNPNNRPETKGSSGILEATENDFVHNNDDLENALEASETILEFVEDKNDKNVNKSTFKATIELMNTWEEACDEIFTQIEKGKGIYDADKFGALADEEADNTIKHLLKPTTLVSWYQKYLEAKVITKDRKKNNIPIHADDFKWSIHADKFIEYYKLSGNGSDIDRVKPILKQIIKNRRSDE